MRKYLLPSFLILALAGSLALAQNINKALQLSQDSTGAFGVDTNSGVYFPGHILNTGTAGPAPTIAGTGTPTISGTDVGGLITMGSSATTATATFGRAYVSVPACVVTWQVGVTPVTSMTYTLLTTSIAISQASTSGNKINYFCTAAS